MAVVFDSTIALFLFTDRTGTPVDAVTKKPIERAKERFDLLIKELTLKKIRIIIPTPVLAEILVGAGKAAPAYLAKIQTVSAIKIEPFDIKAAVHVAWMASQPGDRPRNKDETYAKIKYDRQIAAIAKACGATAIYSDDGNVKGYARRLQMEAIGIADLPLPAPPEPTLFDIAAADAQFAAAAASRDSAELAKLESEMDDATDADLIELRQLDGAAEDEAPEQPSGAARAV